jgi:hypothetical protein
MSKTEQDPQKPTQDAPPRKEAPQDQPPPKQYGAQQLCDTPELESEGSDEERTAAEERGGYDEDSSVRGTDEDARKPISQGGASKTPSDDKSHGGRSSDASTGSPSSRPSTPTHPK